MLLKDIYSSRDVVEDCRASLPFQQSVIQRYTETNATTFLSGRLDCLILVSDICVSVIPLGEKLSLPDGHEDQSSLSEVEESGRIFCGE